MPHRTLVTGFLPFGNFHVNPSALLAQSCGRPFELLEVSFAAVDAFLDRLALAPDTFDRLLMLGLRGNGSTIDLERLARNHVGPAPDVRGVIRGPAPIDPAAPDTLSTTLFNRAFAAAPPAVSFSTDAGCYLCNYLYFRALQRLPDKQVDFVHVPPLNVSPLETQQRDLAALISTVESAVANAQ
jgi:pyroglutamyl-peptidase